MMNIYVEKDDTWKIIKFKGTVSELLEKLKINKETVLVVSNGELVTASDVLSEDDDVKILSVISGG